MRTLRRFASEETQAVWAGRFAKALEATNGSLRLVGVPSLWASWETDRSPALRFLKASQELQLNPLDA